MPFSCFILSMPSNPFGSRGARALRLAFFTMLPVAAAAQSTLDPVVVTGTREPQNLSRSTADIVAISSETIRNSTADTVEDLLRREAGIQIARNGGPGQTTGFFVRGASTNSTVVLVDGVRVGSASLGQAELESLSLAMVDHIEVLRGPASSLYGADAVGGVIQIFTRRGQGGAPRVTAGAAVGGHHSRAFDAGVSGAAGPFDYSASLARESSDGVSAIRPNDANGYYNPDNDGYQRNSGQLQLGWTPVQGHRIGILASGSRLDSHYDSADFAPPTFAPNANLDFRTRLHTSVSALNYRGVINPLWTTTAQVSHNVDDSNSGATSPSRFKTLRDQATWQNALNLAPNQQVVLAYERIGEKLETQAFQPRRHNDAAIAGYSGQFGANGIEGSLRWDHSSAYGSHVTGRLGYSFQLTNEIKLRAAAGNTFRGPSFNDLYYPGFSNPNLKAERGRSVEVGAGWRSGGTTADLTVYRNKVKDLIGYGCAVGVNVCNVSRATLQGATLSAGQTWGGLTVRGIVDLLDARNDDTNVRLTRRAAHQETITADYASGPWTVGGSVVDVGSRPDFGKTLGGYATVDLRATWRVMPQWRLEAKLLNAMNHRVEPLRDYQGLGRQAWVGVRYDGLGL